MSVRTKTSVASVRGTKFYTFNMGESFGTCMCQGSADYKAAEHEFHQTQNQDHMIFTRGNKTIILTPEDLKPIIGGKITHNHSALTNSPLGEKASMTPAQLGKLMTLIEKKFKE